MLILSIYTHPFLDIIKEYEGFSPVPYTCPAGLKTIGYGHVIGRGESYNRITEWQADCLFAQDIAKSIYNLQEIAPELFDDDSDVNKIVAILSFVYNIGETKFRKSTLLKRISEKNWSAAGNEILRWDKTTDPKTGNKIALAGLTKRRQAEALLFMEGRVKKF